MPDLTEFVPYRVVTDAPFEGMPVPGLRAEFFRRAEGDRIASVGRYSMASREILLAWGYVDEEHCRRHGVRDPAGGWHAVTDGCPQVELITDGQAVVGLAVRTPAGDWVRARR